MITYDKSVYGVSLLLRVHGSAAYRAIIPGMLSIACLIVMRYLRNGDGTLSYDVNNREETDLQHPYAIGLLVASTTFLIVFRANNGYNRYWEACGAVHQMMSKWMDATIHTGCYHMQCAHYDAIKPPSFFDYPELNAYFLTRAREREFDAHSNRKEDVMHDLDGGPIAEEPTDNNDDQQRRHVAEAVTGGTKRQKSSDRAKDFSLPPGSSANDNVMVDRAVLKTINPVKIHSAQSFSERSDRLKRKFSHDSPEAGIGGANVPIPLTGPPRLDGNWGKLFPDRRATFFQPKDTDPSSPNYLNSVPSFASVQGGRTPSLFLQELTHLCSLMNAVALSTLRNDMEFAPSPLGVYKPGAPWPEVDPDKLDSYYLIGPWYSRLWEHIKYFLGVPRNPEQRTRYNACRPLEVLGGVSDAEIRFLQMARGPSAKTQLCWYWLTEFVIREHLNGSTGKVGPPIISRVIQFLSDGMIYYNHARKIMFIPFPFPHAQISVMFVLIAIPAVAFLMDQYADNIYLGSLLTFVSVACLSGIHEVARELENPFRNVPNEIPVVSFQAQFNEALIVMYSGYHPDHFWDPTKHDHHPSEPTPRQMRKYRSTAKSPRPSTINTLNKDEATTRSSGATSPTPPRLSGGGIKRTSSAPSTTELEKSKANGAAAEIATMHAKMEEYGKEIERLRSLLEKTEEKKAD